MNYSDVAKKYAEDCLSGKVLVCRYVILSCQRFLIELKDDESEYYYDDGVANKVCKFIETLPHTKGEWLHKGLLLKLEPWQIFIVCNLFGWLNKQTGLRKYLDLYAEIPRKNGKSVLIAAIGLYMLCADNESGAEVYSGATTEKQAWEVFKPAKLMAEKKPNLKKHFGLTVNAKSITKLSDFSKFEPIIGNPGDGASPSCAINDEYHEHKANDLYDTMKTGMGARRQPLILSITTAGQDIGGPCYDMRSRVVDMLEGVIKDNTLFGIIYTIDEGDDWACSESLKKANPNYDVSVYGSYLKSQQQIAIDNARKAGPFRTKHLNNWVTSRSAFFNMAQWNNQGDRTLVEDDFRNEECVLGLDLARKLDMNSMAKLYTRVIDGKRHYYSINPSFWVPEDTAYKTDLRALAERYQAWADEGFLELSYGQEIDYRDILEKAKSVHLDTPVRSCPIDPHGAIALTHSLDDEGLNPVTVTQNFTNLSTPMKELEAAIASGRFHHDGNPIMTWCISNVVGKNMPGNDDIVRPVKEKDENKIDGAVALIMAISQLMVAEDEITADDLIYAG